MRVLEIKLAVWIDDETDQLCMIWNTWNGTSPINAIKVISTDMQEEIVFKRQHHDGSFGHRASKLKRAYLFVED